MRKRILDLSNTEAKQFFLKQESYITLELPPYFSFSQMLSDILKINGDSYLTIGDLSRAKKYENVNHVIYGNKDGRYAWRKFDFINPLIYISLVNVITKKDHWEFIIRRLRELTSYKSIKCLSIPVIPDEGKSQKSSQINEWVSEVEKESIRLALKFEYVYHTDISNCYGAIYTHSLAWAIHSKGVSKKLRDYNQLLGNMVDHHLQAMSNGQTNGIPQGSLLMDFIAEIVLAYADSELSIKLKDLAELGTYKILRYRDDYRIFVRNQLQGELIIKALSEVLMSMGLHLNKSKTINSSDIIFSSIKPDKKILLLSGTLPDNLSKKNILDELLFIYDLGKTYPNCGSVKKRLMNLLEKYKLDANKYFNDQEIELISILSNIGIDNPNSIPSVAAMISIVLSNLNNIDKLKTFNNLHRKFGLLPNSGLSEIWLQRISIPNRIDIEYKETLCKIVGKTNCRLFNTDWINNKKITKCINSVNFINTTELENIDTIINSNEVSLFNFDYEF